ncbi:alpha,alpha-trehalase TreA [Lichenicoccus sp.]|uniref:alpha,alpha-trehalase TreA n=1 Tax=Lichenicoccus sp. TaxID=2781899 RepID=UPI003D112FEC
MRHRDQLPFRQPWVVAACVAATLAAAPIAARAQTVGPDYPTPPSIEYGPLYSAVELAPVFTDSKTFPDLLPLSTPQAIVAAFQSMQTQPGFNLAMFVAANFTGPIPAGPNVQPAAPGTTLLAYVSSLWPVLTQTTRTVPAYSTLLPLPYPYVVPGGRFREVYYWDSYFTMLGLEGDGQQVLARDMLKDFAFEIDKYGHIPNGDRSYYLSRSQPPFFSLMVELVARTDGIATYTRYLPEMLAEYDYWMQGANTLTPNTARRNVVKLADGTVLNRYWDARDVPRDESYREDVITASTATRPAPVVYRNLRATAESGWDFSSRWLADGKTLQSDRTLDILPPDLNSLMAHLELSIGYAYAVKGDLAQAASFLKRAITRTGAIDRLMFDTKAGAYTDYLWRQGRTTGELTAASLYPLFIGIASPDKALIVGRAIQDKLLDVGGLETTLVQSGQQWDRPNGWAPLQWIAVQGLRHYGMAALAKTIAQRWVAKNIAGYQQSAKLVEKYNVTTTGGDAGGGGEYATQIGFGWTNGVLIALTNIYPDLKTKAAAAVAN